jgi:hypothetical protein
MNILRRFGYRGLLWDTLVSFDDGQSSRAARSAAL